MFTGVSYSSKMGSVAVLVSSTRIRCENGRWSYNRFRNIKKYFQLADNYIDDAADRLAKFMPLAERLCSESFSQPIFEHRRVTDPKLSKLFIRGKPIRFGFKYWCQCFSNDGYLSCLMPYMDAILWSTTRI